MADNKTVLANVTILMEHYRQQLSCSHILDSVKKMIIYVVTFMADYIYLTLWTTAASIAEHQKLLSVLLRGTQTAQSTAKLSGLQMSQDH